jgi:hypothetical protein
MLLLPRELRDEIYRQLFKTSHIRLRLTNEKESERIRDFTAKGKECKATPTRYPNPTVISKMVEGVDFLATNRQIYDEAMRVLLEENAILLVARVACFLPGLDLRRLQPIFEATVTEAKILSTTKVLELCPTSWDQFDGIIASLSCRSVNPFKSLTLNFVRLLYDLSYEEWPRLEETRVRFMKLQGVGRIAEVVRIVWVRNPVDAFEEPMVYDYRLQQYVEKEGCGQMREIIDETEGMMMVETAVGIDGVRNEKRDA